MSSYSLRDLLRSVVTPLPTEEVSKLQEQWFQAVERVGDGAQVAIGGKEAVQSLVARLALRRPADKMSAGVFAPIVEECGCTFVEECAKIIEICSSCVTSDAHVASRVLGCAVRLAEALGQTGPLLKTLEDELNIVIERVQHLEILYDVLVKRMDSFAGEIPFLKEKVSEECTAKTTAHEKTRELERTVKNAAQQQRLAEKQKAELRSELRQSQQEVQALQSVASRRPKLRKNNTPFELQIDFDTVSVGVQAGDGMAHRQQRQHLVSPSTEALHSVQFSSDEARGDKDKYRRRASTADALVNPSPSTSLLEKVRLQVPPSLTSPRLHVSSQLIPPPLGSANSQLSNSKNVAGIATPADRSSCASSEVSSLGTCIDAHRLHLLEQGAMWVMALKQTDPMAANVRAAFEHMATLVRGAQESHPATAALLYIPQDSEDPTRSLSPAHGLGWVAGSVANWAHNTIAPLDRALATSITIGTANLQMLLGLNTDF